MRIFLLVLSLIFISHNQAFTQDVESSVSEPKTFKEAYDGYTRSVAQRKELTKANSSRDSRINMDHQITFYAQSAYEMGVEKYGKEHINTINLALNWLAAYTVHAQGHDKPRQLIKSAFKDFEKAAKDDPSLLVDINIAYGNYLVRQSSQTLKRESLSYYRKAINILKATVSEYDPLLAQTYLDIGQSLYEHYNISKTRQYFTKARDIFAKHPVKRRLSHAIANHWVARAYLTDFKYQLAAKSMSASLETMDEVYPSSPYALSGHAFMVQILEKQGKSDEATLHCQKIGRLKPRKENQDYLPLFRKPPSYPYGAAHRGLEGWVIVEFNVDEQGFVREPFVVDHTAGKIFDEASLDAVLGFRYAPTFRKGIAVNTSGVRTRFTYQMAKR